MEKVIVAKSQERIWEDCLMDYICECGNRMTLDSQNEPTTCIAYVQEHLEE